MNNIFHNLCLKMILTLSIAIIELIVDTKQISIANINSEITNFYIINNKTLIDFKSNLLYQMHQNLLDVQHDIDILRGHIQENKYQLSKIINKQKEFSIELESLTIRLNKTIDNIITNNIEINNTTAKLSKK
ncbi:MULTISPECIES: YbgF trimerization domain-containing protein [Arsenophonus]|uniref:YbgF trimerization domain-containing protein n=1 Tax=Arsenophonus TaxID=637 RepID=UPI00083432B4|nr:YbgF trimerization domain-containing protein [Candidatus Arsenophonus lipoptenae]